MNVPLSRLLMGSALAATLLATAPALTAHAARPVSRAGHLDLSVPNREAPAAAPSPEDPRYATEMRRRSPTALLPVAGRDGDVYRSQPLFQHEQRLQVLDAEVPLSLKLGKWKTHDDGKALGLSATVPLRDPLQ